MSDTLRLSRNSMFRSTPVYSVGGEVVFGLRRESIGKDPTDQVIEVTQPMVDRLDNIAYELYGDSNLWWVIAEMNQLVDPMREVSLGTELRVPTRDRLYRVLSS